MHREVFAVNLLIVNVNVYHSDSMRFEPGALSARDGIITGVYSEKDALPGEPDVCTRTVLPAETLLLPTPILWQKWHARTCAAA